MTERTFTPSIRQIVASVAFENGVSLEDIYSRTRKQTIVNARQKAMCAVADVKKKLSLPQIGRHFDRDHTTVIHALQKYRPHSWRILARREGRATFSIRVIFPITLDEPHIFPQPLVETIECDHPPSHLGKLCRPAFPSIHEALRALLQAHGWGCFSPFNISDPSPRVRQNLSDDRSEHKHSQVLLPSPQSFIGGVLCSTNRVTEMTK